MRRTSLYIYISVLVLCIMSCTDKTPFGEEWNAYSGGANETKVLIKRAKDNGGSVKVKSDEDNASFTITTSQLKNAGVEEYEYWYISCYGYDKHYNLTLYPENATFATPVEVTVNIDDIDGAEYVFDDHVYAVQNGKITIPVTKFGEYEIVTLEDYSLGHNTRHGNGLL